MDCILNCLKFIVRSLFEYRLSVMWHIPGKLEDISRHANNQEPLLSAIRTHTTSLGKEAFRARQEMRDLFVSVSATLSTLVSSVESLSDTVATKDDIYGLHHQLGVIQELLQTCLSVQDPA